MAVKRFVAPDMRRALDLVRQEMGPDAIILSSKRVAEGVEILTAQELDLPTRGYDTRKEFGQRFDADNDRPLASDQAWRPQGNPPQVPQSYAAPAVNETAARASQLAAEIEAARERMIAAKRNADAAHRPIGEPQIRPQRTEPRFDEHAFADLEEVTTRREPKLAFEAVSQLDQPLPTTSRPQQDRQLAGLAAQVEKMRVAPGKAAAPVEDRRLLELQNEVADMRSLLEQHLHKMTQPAQRFSPVNEPPIVKAAVNHAALSQHLTRLGLPGEVAEPLCQQFGAEPRLNIAWRDALNDLVGQLPVNTGDCIDKGGIFAFVGNTGVGKTTSIAKLAARYVLTHGQGKVALVTTDTYRVGAQDQLRALGRILNVPVRVIDQERSLPAVLSSLKAFPLVLIDTAGFRQGDPLLKEQEAMLASCADVQRILVMAGNSQLQTLKASAHAYKSRHLAGCILTKIDETLSLGEVISVLIQQAIPLLYTSDGQEIPKDIAIASGHNLVAKAVSLTKNQERSHQELVGSARR